MKPIIFSSAKSQVYMPVRNSFSGVNLLKRFFFVATSLLITSTSMAQMEYVEVRDQDGSVRKFSRLIMGTDHLAQGDWVQAGQPVLTKDQIFAILDEAVRNGVNVIDTSPIYVGGIEHIVGEWLQSRNQVIQVDTFYNDRTLNPDRKIYVLSKGGFPFDLFYSRVLEPGQHSGELIEKLRKKNILADSGKSGPQQLQNVPPGTYASRLYGDATLIKQRVSEELDYTTQNLNGALTVYILHRDDFDSIGFEVINQEKTPANQILTALSSKELTGKFALFGLSNWTADRVNEALAASQENPALARPMFNSPYFSLFEMNDARSIHAGGIQVKHDDMMDPAFLKGVLFNSYSPLGGFSILDKSSPSWENAKADAKRKYDAGDAYWQNVYPAIFTPENEMRYRRAISFLQKFNQVNNTNFTIDQLLNAYALAHKRADFLTVGPVSVEQVKRTINALPLSKHLTTQDLDYLNKVDASPAVLSCKEIYSSH